MEIIDNTIKESKDFWDVEIGAVFKYNNDIYLSVEMVRRYEDDYRNAVNLNNGELVYFKDEDKVEVLKAKLIVS